jgi:predicted RecA/RadA family phage recombinase
MATGHISSGTTMPYTNTGSAITKGTVVEFTGMIGIALGDIPATTGVGELAITGVWTVAKEAPLVITQGDQVWWDATNNNVDKTNTNIPCGRAYASALSADTTVQIILNA